MHKLTLYQQKRQDGGRRVAITIDDDTVFHRFEPGEEDSDPALEWFVDVRCLGKRLPTEPEEVRQWFLDQAPLIHQGLTEFAEKVNAGVDIGSRPLQFPISPSSRSVKMTIVCSALHRTTCLEFASILLGVRDSWEQTVRSLPLVTQEASKW